MVALPSSHTPPDRSAETRFAGATRTGLRPALATGGSRRGITSHPSVPSRGDPMSPEENPE